MKVLQIIITYLLSCPVRFPIDVRSRYHFECPVIILVKNDGGGRRSMGDNRTVSAGACVVAAAALAMGTFGAGPVGAETLNDALALAYLNNPALLAQRAQLLGLIETLKAGDRLIVSELSRLGRSLNQILQIVDRLMHKGVRFVAIK